MIVALASLALQAGNEEVGKTPTNPTGSPIVAEIDRVGQESATRAVLTIGTDGRARSCSVEESSGSAKLDEAACKTLMTRARWSPLIDSATGKRVERVVRQRIVWRIEE